jgi:N6-L-threonylcarbamoyladenine synthase
LVRGFRLFDKVLFGNQECFIFGRRQRGLFNIRLLDGTKIHTDANCGKMKLLEKRKSLLWEKRKQGIGVSV